MTHNIPQPITRHHHKFILLFHLPLPNIWVRHQNSPRLWIPNRSRHPKLPIHPQPPIPHHHPPCLSHSLLFLLIWSAVLGNQLNWSTIPHQDCLRVSHIRTHQLFITQKHCCHRTPWYQPPHQSKIGKIFIYSLKRGLQHIHRNLFNQSFSLFCHRSFIKRPKYFKREQSRGIISSSRASMTITDTKKSPIGREGGKEGRGMFDDCDSVFLVGPFACFVCVCKSGCWFGLVSGLLLNGTLIINHWLDYMIIHNVKNGINSLTYWGPKIISFQKNIFSLLPLLFFPLLIRIILRIILPFLPLFLSILPLPLLPICLPPLPPLPQSTRRRRRTSLGRQSGRVRTNRLKRRASPSSSFPFPSSRPSKRRRGRRESRRGRRRKRWRMRRGKRRRGL